MPKEKKFTPEMEVYLTENLTEKLDTIALKFKVHLSTVADYRKKILASKKLKIVKGQLVSLVSNKYPIPRGEYSNTTPMGIAKSIL